MILRRWLLGPDVLRKRCPRLLQALPGPAASGGASVPIRKHDHMQRCCCQWYCSSAKHSITCCPHPCPAPLLQVLHELLGAAADSDMRVAHSALKAIGQVALARPQFAGQCMQALLQAAAGRQASLLQVGCTAGTCRAKALRLGHYHMHPLTVLTSPESSAARPASPLQHQHGHLWLRPATVPPASLWLCPANGQVHSPPA